MQVVVKLDFRLLGGGRFTFPLPSVLISRACLLPFSPNKAKGREPSVLIKAEGPRVGSHHCLLLSQPSCYGDGPAAPPCVCWGSGSGHRAGAHTFHCCPRSPLLPSPPWSGAQALHAISLTRRASPAGKSDGEGG